MYCQTYIVLILLALGLFTACGGDDCITGEPSIDEYLNANNLSANELDDTGLRYIILEAGDATQRPELTDTVVVNYVGYTTDGPDEVFDQTMGTPIAFPLNGLINSWQLGIPLIGEGGRIQLFSPASLAYANAPAGSLCPNSDLIFEVELVEVR